MTRAPGRARGWGVLIAVALTSCSTGDEGAGCGGGATSVLELLHSTDDWSTITEAELVDAGEAELSDEQKAMAAYPGGDQVAPHITEGEALAGSPAADLIVDEDDGDASTGALERGERVYAAASPMRSYLLMADDAGDAGRVRGVRERDLSTSQELRVSAKSSEKSLPIA